MDARLKFLQGAVYCKVKIFLYEVVGWWPNLINVKGITSILAIDGYINFFFFIIKQEKIWTYNMTEHKLKFL